MSAAVEAESKPLEEWPVGDLGECLGCAVDAAEAARNGIGGACAVDLCDSDGRLHHIRRLSVRDVCGSCHAGYAGSAAGGSPCGECGSRSVLRATACGSCRGPALPLPGLCAAAGGSAECSVCLEPRAMFVAPGGRCTERACVECYVRILATNIRGAAGREGGLLAVRDENGDGAVARMTVSGCAGCGCSTYLVDGLVGLVGRSLCRLYRDTAARAYAGALTASGCVCPLPGCAGVVTELRPLSDGPVVRCPDCRRHYCRHEGCRSAAVIVRGAWTCPRAAMEDLMVPGVMIIQPSSLVVESTAVGHGASGTVFRGRYHGAFVAVKVLKECDAPDTDIRAELLAMSRVGPHPCVVALLGVSKHDGRPCIVSEFMPRGSLLDVLRGGNPQPSLVQCLEMARDAAAGVVHLHAAGVVHRDLAARNLLIDAQYNVKVCDFGYARAIEGCGDLSALTKSNVGPVPWMAPESLRAHRYSTKSDVYMFGVTLLELFTRGAVPWDGMTLLEAAHRVLAGETLEFMFPASAVPEVLQPLLRKCWLFAPADRPDMAAVHAELSAAAAAAGAASAGVAAAPAAGDGVGAVTRESLSADYVR